jgi:hypothetical protein
MLAWLLATYRESGPYPILKQWGEPGVAKSTQTEVLRSLVDPHKVIRRRLPKEDRDLFIAANNAWILSYDNVSHIQPWLSDSLCTVSTGGGHATRTLYTDSDEQLFEAKRPVIMNGVENFITRHDLADRMILLELPFIPPGSRLREKEFWTKFETARPKILGALFDVVAHGLKKLPEVPEEDWPRLADFSHWVTACEGALWKPGTFRRVYTANRKKSVLSAIDDDPVATALRGFMSEDKSEWRGTTSQLLDILTKRVGEKVGKSKDWPESPRALTGRLQKARGALRRVGIGIQTSRTRRERILTITPNLDEVPPLTKDRDNRHDRHDRHFDRKNKNLGDDGMRDDRAGIDTRSSRRNSLKSNEK